LESYLIVIVFLKRPCVPNVSTESIFSKRFGSVLERRLVEILLCTLPFDLR
jgi:hypothetical protein